MIGTLLLMLPVSRNEGIQISLIDALFTSTSAVCVTGLIAIDAADNFSVFGRFVLAGLIQIGGLGITSIGVGLIMLSGRKIDLRTRTLASEAMNYGSLKGVVAMVRAVLVMTLCFELAGTLLSFLVFSQEHPFWEALGISAFHSVAAFNNAGFDILGGMRNLIPYQDNVLLNLTTCGLIIFGGLGFFVIREVIEKRSFRKFSLHTKVVLTMTGALLVAGTLLLKTTENVTWMGAFFNSTSARTAGFSTYPLSDFTNAGLFTLIILMFIGASPGSTGGGIKTTTFFVLIQGVFAASTKKHPQAFKRSLPHELLYKAFVIMILSVTVVIISTFLLCIAEPEIPFISLLFEATSAFGTVGLSTGITPGLSEFSKLVIIITMYIGRLGPLAIASLWAFKPVTDVSYAKETITIG